MVEPATEDLFVRIMVSQALLTPLMVHIAGLLTFRC